MARSRRKIYEIAERDNDGEDMEVSRLIYDKDSKYSIIAKIYQDSRIVSLVFNENHAKVHSGQ